MEECFIIPGRPTWVEREGGTRERAGWIVGRGGRGWETDHTLLQKLLQVTLPGNTHHRGCTTVCFWGRDKEIQHSRGGHTRGWASLWMGGRESLLMLEGDQRRRRYSQRGRKGSGNQGAGEAEEQDTRRRSHFSGCAVGTLSLSPQSQTDTGWSTGKDPAWFSAGFTGRGNTKASCEFLREIHRGEEGAKQGHVYEQLLRGSMQP